MNKIYATILLIALSSKIFSQTSTNGYVPNKIVNWEPYNSYIIAGVAATLGAIVSTKYTVEITTQAGPSINWFRNDEVSLSEFYSPLNHKIDFSHIWGYSAGITIGTARPGLNVKSGVFLESKGRSYSSSGFVTTYVQQDGYGYGYNKEIWIETQGTSRLNYITIPIMAGIQTEGHKTTLSLDLGGFVSLPISEHHTSTYNGVVEDFEPMNTIGVDAGLLADIGVRIPISERLHFRTDLRHAAGLANTQKLVYSAYTQSTQILFGIVIRPKAK